MASKISRRNFLKLLSGGGLLGASALLSGCGGEMKNAGGGGWLPDQYSQNGAWPATVRGRVAIAPHNPSIMRDDEKCILCGQCAEVCDKVMSVHNHYPLPITDGVACVHCGQCTLWCPSGAITERYDTDEVETALADESKFVVVQTAPATKVSLGEEFGLAPGSIVDGHQVAALKALGFDAVLDTCYSADLTIMEEAAEALHRLTVKKDELPHLTSCCPGWVKFCVYFYPELIKNLSTCKSPQGMMGATIKAYYAKKRGISPEKIVSVSIMPCTAKKFEAKREELTNNGLAGIDIVLTTRELANLIQKHRIDWNSLKPMEYDSILGESTGAGRIFGATGGVTEAAIRTLYYFATKERPPEELLNWQPVRGLQAVKEATVNVPSVGEAKVAVCHGLANARTLLDNIKANGSPWQFIEFMACPGGCIGGGGQPKSSAGNTPELRQARISAIYRADVGAPKRCSYENAEIQQVYTEFYGQPLSERAEEYLHTTFVNRHRTLFAEAEGGGKQ